MKNERSYFVANDNGVVAGHDLDLATAEVVCEEERHEHPNENWEVLSTLEEDEEPEKVGDLILTEDTVIDGSIHKLLKV